MSTSSQIPAPRPDVSLLYWQRRRRRAVGRDCYGCSDMVTVMIMTVSFMVIVLITDEDVIKKRYVSYTDEGTTGF